MSEISSTLETITHGYDGLVRKVCLLSLSDAVVVISARRKDSAEWVNVEFRISGLTEFSVRQSAGFSNVVLSGGIAHQCIDGIHFVDFAPYSDAMEGADDFRMSGLYFAGASVACCFLPYSECA